ncbi:hypothetical protein V8E51_012443 [Hyaloscypha variabilis]
MANDIIEQVEPHIREILRLCGVLDAEGGELHKLNELVGRTIQNHLFELNGRADSPCPITVEFKRLRRSGRLASRTKRSYESMQGANKRTGTLLKKAKLAADEPAIDESAVDESATDDSTTNEPPNDKPLNDELVSEAATLEPINDSTVTKPYTMEPLENVDVPHREDADEIMARSALISPVHETTVGGTVDCDLPVITHADGMVILDEYFPTSAVDLRTLNGVVAPDELSTSTTDTAYRNFPLIPSIPSFPPKESNSSPDIISSESSSLPNAHQSTSGFKMSTPNARSPGSISSCEDLSSCLSSETDGTDFGSLDIATHTPVTRRLALDDTAQLLEHVLVALESAYDDSRIPGLSVPGILENVLTKGHHSNFVKIMTSVTENWAKCNQRVKSQRLKHAIACLDVREVLGIELQDLLSEPAELVGEFSEESDYENMIGPLPESLGPKTEITLQEKMAAKKLIAAMGYDKGITAFLLGRTISWNNVYDFPLRQLRLRVIAQEWNDFSGQSDIEERWIYNRLRALQNMCWGDHLSVWNQDLTEYEDFLANHNLKPSSTKSNIHVLRHGIKGQLDRNKSIYVSLVPYEGQSDRRALSNKAALTELLAVAPLVAVAPGDFLGLFPGRLRYTDQKLMRAVSGPVPNLWLDYSDVMGKLNKVKVAKAGEMTNVYLAWEGVNEVKGDKSFCQYLRVLVIATRHIMPFDHLIRPSSGAAPRT